MNGRHVPNTLGVDCIADDIRLVHDEDDLAEQLVYADTREIPATIIGGGSNLVLRARLPGVAILLKLEGTAFERLGDDDWRVVAAAGENWQTVVDGALQRGIGGLENLTLIPGSVGAAPVQNIGAYGRELSEFLESVTVFDRQRQCYSTLTGVQCGFGYRDSVFKRDASNRYVIARLALRLGGTALATDYPDVARELAGRGGRVDRNSVAHAVAKVRRRKLPDPARIGNVGSFFKNPVVTTAELDHIRALVDIDDYPAPARSAGRKIPAARLIDAAGWKGVRKDQVQVWPRQPLVLVNLGGATGGAVLDLATGIRDDVHQRYGVALELEPAVLGTDAPR
ncbi:MAG: UDP-N-acetylmuramate dehydrogenase [Gammaproteobacteria bacterium]|nr:UDP-N-acetylmuramate dehydrogenase [Gammaproteobacteria bacterium]